MRLFEVTFQPDGIKTKVPAEITLMEAANQAGIILNSVCGGTGTCKKCLVEVDGQPESVLACQTPVNGDMVVTIPDDSRFFEQKILQEGIAAEAVVDPLVCKHHVKLSEPTLKDLRSDASRLIDAVNSLRNGHPHTCRDHAGTASERTTIAWGLLRQLPSLFRDHDFSVTTVCHSGRIFALEAADTTSVLYGLAADIGTTTVVANLVNLISGKTIATASETNPQVTFGDDVISRIEHCRAHPDGLQQLHHRIIDCLNRLIGQLCEKTLVDRWHIYEMTAAGNATMQHLLMGVPVEQIAQAPYVSTVSSAVNIPAGSLGINIHPQGNVYIMPSVAAHVGGDTVAVGLATAMRHSEKINLAIDIGTNGELLLGNKDHLYACSTAAGPAFEGARIQRGMRGAAGAIERLIINQDVEITVIGGVEAVGICGSGLIDALAELLNVGVVDMTGRILSGEELPPTVSPAVRERVVQEEGKPAFVLATAAQTRQRKPILLTQRDVREAQLGKAAIHAGIITLMKQASVRLEDIHRLYLAGAFGNYIRPESARRIGLLPNVPLEKIQFVGNAACAGARQVLLSAQARRHAQQLGADIEYVELAGRSDFQNVFTESMLFDPI